MFDRPLVVINALSKLLQAESQDLTAALSLVMATEAMRCETKWNETCKTAVVLARENDIPVET